MKLRDIPSLPTALLSLTVVHSMIALFGIARTQRTLSRWSRRTGNTQFIELIWERRSANLQRASRLLPRARCISRSLALWWWMRRSGLNPTIAMGVRSDQDGIAGHAWVECDGVAIGESADVKEAFKDIGWKTAAARDAE